MCLFRAAPTLNRPCPPEPGSGWTGLPASCQGPSGTNRLPFAMTVLPRARPCWRVGHCRGPAQASVSASLGFPRRTRLLCGHTPSRLFPRPSAPGAPRCQLGPPTALGPEAPIPQDGAAREPRGGGVPWGRPQGAPPGLPGPTAPPLLNCTGTRPGPRALGTQGPNPSSGRLRTVPLTDATRPEGIGGRSRCGPEQTDTCRSQTHPARPGGLTMDLRRPGHGAGGSGASRDARGR